MDTQSRRQSFPQLIAREKAHSLERFNRLHRQASAARVWRSWGDVAGYSAKRMSLLSARAARPLERAQHRSIWFATVRQHVAQIGREACQNPWKRTVDISIRRFRDWWDAPYDNQLWMAVAFMETSRLTKRTGKQKPVLPGWDECFIRNRFRISYTEAKPFGRNLWELCALRSTKLRFSSKSNCSYSVDHFLTTTNQAYGQ